MAGAGAGATVFVFKFAWDAICTAQAALARGNLSKTSSLILTIISRHKKGGALGGIFRVLCQTFWQSI